MLHHFHRVEDGVIDIVDIEEMRRHGLRILLDAATVFSDAVRAHDAVGII